MQKTIVRKFTGVNMHDNSSSDEEDSNPIFRESGMIVAP